MIESASSQQTIEGEFLMKNHAFNTLKLETMHLDVMKYNKTVIFFINNGARLKQKKMTKKFFDLNKTGV